MTAMLEVQRVAAHIQRAESIAAARDVSQLSHVQRLVRQLLLQALADYRGGGQFPKNRDFVEKRPYFIDADGTRCAMAHLMELGGEHDLVAKIARERNNAYVRELADEIAVWLDAAGLTVEEAAAIQPEYCGLISECICGGSFSPIEYPIPARGALEGVVMANGKLRVDRTYGDALGITSGMEVSMATDTFQQHAIGDHVVAPIDSATTPVNAIGLAAGEYACSSQGVSQAPPLTADEFAAAVTSSDCHATLKAQNSTWGKSSCEPDDPLRPIGDPQTGGCSTSMGAEAASVGILLALVTALARRR